MNEELDSFIGTEDEPTVVETDVSQDSESITESEPDASQGVTGEPPAPAEKPQETMIPLAAKQAEKERRKQAEQERDNLRIQLARYEGMQQAQTKPAPEAVPDPYTDPENYTKYVVNQQSQRLAQQNQAQLKARLASAEEVARVELEDYDTHAEYFAQVVAPNNPQLVEMMLASPDPAKFAYYKGRQHKQDTEIQDNIKKVGGLDAYTKAIREQARAEALASVNVKPEPKIPPDLTGMRNAGGDPAIHEIADGTDGLNQLLGR